MTLIKPINGDVTNDCVTVASQHFEKAILAVADITKKIERQELEALPELTKAAPHATHATKMLLQEIGRANELHKKQSGVAHDYAIDFAAARSEIGRRLACLREAGGG